MCSGRSCGGQGRPVCNSSTSQVRRSFSTLQLLRTVSWVGAARQMHALQVADMTGHAANRMQMVHGVIHKQLAALSRLYAGRP